MFGLTSYQIFLIVTMITWPFVIVALLFFMGKIEAYVNRVDAETPEEAGLEPVLGRPEEREVRIVLGDKVVG